MEMTKITVDKHRHDPIIPTMTKRGHTDRTLHIGLTTEQWDEIRDRATHECISIATLARKALRLYVNPRRKQTQHIL